MSYRVGFCPICQERVQVQDTNGRWNTYKPNFRQVDLMFEDGHRLRTILCSECFEKEPQFEKLMDSIICKKSEACGKKRKDRIQQRGLPISWALANAKQGASLSK